MKTNRNEIAFLLAVCVLALVALTCGTPVVEEEPEVACPSPGIDPQEGCDEFKRLTDIVKYNSVAYTVSGWHLLNDGDTLSTEDSGQAQVNVSDCWPGEIYIFRKSGYGFRVEDCSRVLFPNPTHCDPFGTWYVGDCADEFDVIFTGSAKITKTGTTFSVTYLPEDRAITLVVVLQGQVSVEPVLSLEEGELGPPTPVGEEFFYFTMPEPLSDVADFPPREPIPVQELGRVARELGIVDWMLDVRDLAEEKGVLPPSWPPELGGEAEQPPEAPPIGNGFVVTSGGGALNEPEVQEAMLQAINWQSAAAAGAPDGGPVVAFVGDETVDPVNDLFYDPARSRAILEDVAATYGYGIEQPYVILYPAGDQPLEEAAQSLAGDISVHDFEAVLEAVPGSELAAKMSALLAAGEPVIALSR